MAISDHSKGQRQANGLDEARMLAHAEAIHKAAKKYPQDPRLASVEWTS